MIVLSRGGRLLLVRQLDHAALAGDAAAAWGNAGFERPDPAGAVVLAASRHDEGWREWDDQLRFDPARKQPLSFLDVGIDDFVSLYARGIQRIADLDPYAGLLASMHGTGNVCGRWGMQRGIRLTAYDEATWPAVIERYVLEQEALQSRVKLRLLGLNPTGRRSVFERRLWANYELLQAWDRLSLFLCRSDPRLLAEAELGQVPVTLEGRDTEALGVRASGDYSATVVPWPFGQDTVQLSVPVRSIPERPYETADDLRREVERAANQELRWTLIKEAG